MTAGTLLHRYLSGGSQDEQCKEYARLVKDSPTLTRARLHYAHLLWRRGELRSCQSELDAVIGIGSPAYRYSPRTQLTYDLGEVVLMTAGTSSA
jgi:hypothetical protein